MLGLNLIHVSRMGSSCKFQFVQGDRYTAWYVLEIRRRPHNTDVEPSLTTNQCMMTSSNAYISALLALCEGIHRSTVCSGAGQRKHQSSASLAFLWGIHRWISRIKGQCFHLMMSSCSWSLSHLALCLDTNKFVASSLMGGVARHLFDEIINYFDILASPVPWPVQISSGCDQPCQGQDLDQVH